jgi:hypothetical protein
LGKPGKISRLNILIDILFTLQDVGEGAKLWEDIVNENSRRFKKPADLAQDTMMTLKQRPKIEEKACSNI